MRAAQQLKPETLVVVTDPTETGADLDTDESGGNQVSKAVALHLVDLVLLVIKVEMSLVILITAILPVAAIQTHLDCQANVTKEQRTLFSLKLEKVEKNVEW